MPNATTAGEYTHSYLKYLEREVVTLKERVRILERMNRDYERLLSNLKKAEPGV